MIKKIYDVLFKEYGPQGWWPILDVDGSNPTKTGSINGYHIGDYSYPKTKLQSYEICLGAILTQNTSWPQVEKALINLKKLDTINPEKILTINEDVLKEAIKPAGYFNQKANYIIEFTKWFIKLKGTPTRKDVLNIKGVGPETCDSMMLYAFKQPEFVIDAYTKRILLNLSLIKEKEKYDDIKNIFEKSLNKDFKLFQEYHALLVEHAKRYYQKKPYDDPLLNNIS